MVKEIEVEKEREKVEKEKALREAVTKVVKVETETDFLVLVKEIMEERKENQ